MGHFCYFHIIRAIFVVFLRIFALVLFQNYIYSCQSSNFMEMADTDFETA